MVVQANEDKMHVITQSLILFLWMQTLTFVKSQDGCTLQQFLKSRHYDEHFDTSDMDASYPLGKQVRVGCNVGYSGFFKLTCVEGSWQTRGTKCQPKSCGHPGDAQFADFGLVEGDDFVFGSRVVYTCHKGYQMVSRTDFRRCMAGGWDGVVPVCEAQQCPVIHVDSNVLVTGDPDEATYGNVVRFSCKSSNQILIGPMEIYCDENGAWSAEAPKCKEIKCEKPVIENGNVPAKKQQYNEHEVLHFECNTSFQRAEDRPSKCTKFGSRAEWSPTPLCEPTKCRLSQSALEGTTYDPAFRNVFSPGDTLRVICGEKYWISEPEYTSVVTSCKEDGEWTIRPVCQEVRCSNRREQHVNWWNVHWRRRITLHDTVRYTCQRGFKSPDDRNVATCTRNGWKPDPFCQEITCDRQDYPGADIYGTPKEKYGYWDMVSYTCKEGFTGEFTLTCKETGWTGDEGCTEITCKPKKYHDADPEESIKPQYRYNEEVTYACKEGYDGNFTLRCGETGWSEPNQRCVEIICDRQDYPNADIHGSPKAKYKNKEEVKYDCKDGGQFTLTCGKTGWKGTNTCTACSKPSIPRGFIVGPINQVVYFTCDEDYKLFTKGWWGASKCIDGEWSIPKCIGKSECGRIPAIANGQVTKTGQIKCKDGYQSQVNSLSCNDGEWASNGLPLKAICTPVAAHCSPPPKVVNAVVQSAPMKEYLSDSKVTYQCRDNYEMQGGNTLQCKNGTWEMKNIVCKEPTEDSDADPVPNTPQ